MQTLTVRGREFTLVSDQDLKEIPKEGDWYGGPVVFIGFNLAPTEEREALGLNSLDMREGFEAIDVHTESPREINPKAVAVFVYEHPAAILYAIASGLDRQPWPEWEQDLEVLLKYPDLTTIRQEGESRKYPHLNQHGYMFFGALLQERGMEMWVNALVKLTAPEVEALYFFAIRHVTSHMSPKPILVRLVEMLSDPTLGQFMFDYIVPNHTPGARDKDDKDILR